MTQRRAVTSGLTYTFSQEADGFITIVRAGVDLRDRVAPIHRRYLLNLSRLSKIEQSITDSRSAILTDGTELPISRSGYARLKELL